MTKEQETKIILKMAEVREAKQKILNEVLDLEGKIAQKKYNVKLKEIELDNLWLDLLEARL